MFLIILNGQSIDVNISEQRHRFDKYHVNFCYDKYLSKIDLI